MLRIPGDGFLHTKVNSAEISLKNQAISKQVFSGHKLLVHKSTF